MNREGEGANMVKGGKNATFSNYTLQIGEHNILNYLYWFIYYVIIKH